MKAYIRELLLSAVLLILLFGCDSSIGSDDLSSGSIDKILRTGTSFSKTSIHQAREQLALINQDELNESQEAKYNLLYARVNIMTADANALDSLLNISISYYRSTKDTAMLYEALHSLALIKYNTSKYETSIKILDQSEKLLSFFNDFEQTLFNIQLRSNNLLVLNKDTEAENLLETLVKNAQKQGTKNDQMQAYLLLAQIKRINNKITESEQNLLKALEIAENLDSNPINSPRNYSTILVKGKEYLKNYGDNSQNVYQKRILQQLSRLMEQIGRYDKALHYIKEVKDLSNSRGNIPQRNLLKAMLHYNQEEIDSAYYYAGIASQSIDPFIASIATTYISEWYADEGDFLNAYNKQLTAMQIAENIESDAESQKRDKRIDALILRDEANSLKIEQQKKNLMFIITLLLLLFAIGAIYLFFYRKQRKQHERYLKSKALELEQDNLLLQQSSEISTLREKESLLRESLLRRTDIFKKLPSITQGEEQNNKNRKISLTEKDWNELVATIDDAYHNFTPRLKARFPLLNMEDVCFCCFLKIGVNLQDLSDIYCISKSAITKKKYRVKTEKLHIDDNSISLDSFLKTF